MKKFDIYVLVCSLFSVCSQIAGSNRKCWVTNAELFFSAAAAVPASRPHFTFLNTCSYMTLSQPMPASQKVPYCSAQNTRRCLALWRIWPMCTGENRGPLSWLSRRSAWSHSRHLAKGGRKPSIRGSSSLLLFPVLEKPQTHLFAKCFKNKMG